MVDRDPDFRVKYYLEAQDQIKEANKYTNVQTGYWANLAAAGVNALMALFPESLVEDLETEREYRSSDFRRVQREIKRKLKDG
jgi:hypothetical protein